MVYYGSTILFRVSKAHGAPGKPGGGLACLLFIQSDKTSSAGGPADAAAAWRAQIQKIVRSIPPQRQTLFFSATWPREVKQIASQFVTHNTVHVFVGGVEEKLVANKVWGVHFSPICTGKLTLGRRLKPSGLERRSASMRSATLYKTNPALRAKQAVQCKRVFV